MKLLLDENLSDRIVFRILDLYSDSKHVKIAALTNTDNILRKVAKNLGIDLSRLGRRCLTTVGRIRLWALQKFSACPKESHVFQAWELSKVLLCLIGFVILEIIPNKRLRESLDPVFPRDRWVGDSAGFA